MYHVPLHGFLVRSLLTIHRDLDNVPVHRRLESIPDHHGKGRTQLGSMPCPQKGCFVRQYRQQTMQVHRIQTGCFSTRGSREAMTISHIK